MVAYHTVGAGSPDFPAVEAALDLLGHETVGSAVQEARRDQARDQCERTASSGSAIRRSPMIAVEISRREERRQGRADHASPRSKGSRRPRSTTRRSSAGRRGALKNLDLMMTDSQRLAIRLTEQHRARRLAHDVRVSRSRRERHRRGCPARREDVLQAVEPHDRRVLADQGQPIARRSTTTPNIADAVKGIEGGKSVEEGEAFDATLDNIEARTTRTDLKGGIKAAFLPQEDARRQGVDRRCRFTGATTSRSRTSRSSAGRWLRSCSAARRRRRFEDIHDLEDQLKADDLDSRRQCRPRRPHRDAARQAARRDRSRRRDADLAEPARRRSSRSCASKCSPRSRSSARIRSRSRGIEAQAALQPWPKGDPRHTFTAQEQIAIIKNDARSATSSRSIATSSARVTASSS